MLRGARAKSPYIFIVIHFHQNHKPFYKFCLYSPFFILEICAIKTKTGLATPTNPVQYQSSSQNIWYLIRTNPSQYLPAVLSAMPVHPQKV